MVLYQIGPELSLVDHCTEGQVLVLLTSQELSQHPELKCLEGVLQHTPLARDARVCKAEARRDCLCGTQIYQGGRTNRVRLHANGQRGCDL